MAVKPLPAKTRSSSSSTKSKSSAAASTSLAGRTKVAKTVASAKSGKKKASNKYKDAASREQLDSDSRSLLHNDAHKASTEPGQDITKNDPFSYGGGRKEVEAAADALDALCALMT